MNENEEFYFDTYKANGTDINGREIEKIIAKKEKEYVIYFIKNEYIELGIQMKTGLTIEDSITEKINRITTLVETNIPKNSFIREQYAEALSNYMMGYKSLAGDILENLEKKVKAKIKIRENTDYILSGGLFLFIALIISLLTFNNVLKIRNDSLILLVYSTTISGIGGFLHQLIIINSNKDILKQQELNFVNGIYKMFFAFISGFFIFIVIKSNIILGIFSESKYSIFTISFIIGFNQDLVIKLIHKLSKKIIEEDTN